MITFPKWANTISNFKIRAVFTLKHFLIDSSGYEQFLTPVQLVIVLSDTNDNINTINNQKTSLNPFTVSSDILD